MTQACPHCGTLNAAGNRFCGTCGTALDQAASFEGERRFATFLFADVAGSTALAEGMDPEDWTVIMNGAFAFMNAAVTRYGGTVSRLMGDAVLALFGAPVAHEDDAERAVRAGLDLQEAAQAYGRSVRDRYGVDFRMRVGINSGTAVLAFVGDAIRTEYTAMGDAANVAARLQSAAEPGAILISADTLALVRGLFEVQGGAPIAMKGKQAPVGAYEILSLKADARKDRGLRGLSSPLIGRDAELAILWEKLDLLDHGQGSNVAILGEAGIGKSRLLAEIRERWTSRPASVGAWYEGRAVSYGRAIPYDPWRQVTRQVLGVSAMDAPEAVRSGIRTFLTLAALPADGAPFLESLLAVESEESRVQLARLDGAAMTEGIASAVIGALKGRMTRDGAPRPLVVVLDDLHWSDSVTLDLAERVASVTRTFPLLVVCVMRPRREAASWQLLDRLEANIDGPLRRIVLEPLSPASSSAMLGKLLDVRDLPDRVRAVILERADGNPFYLEEILRSLIDSGQIVREGDHWRAANDIVDVKIPETLSGVLSARIDRLPPPTKRVAQSAAVIGRIFSHRLLERVCLDAPPTERIEMLDPHIAALSYEQLVRERAADPDREYIFKHAMTCEAAYNLLLRSRRRELHRRTGHALEKLFGDRAAELSPILAHHFAEADEIGSAVAYTRQAADQAAAVFASKEELELRERALALLDRSAKPDPAAVVDATIEWVLVRHRLNRYEGTAERLERAVELARASGDAARLAQALTWSGNIQMLTGHPSRSIPFILESRDLAEALGDEQLMLLPLWVGTWYLADRDPAAAVATLLQVVELAQSYKVFDVYGHAVSYLAVVLARLGRFPEARAQISRALKAVPEARSAVKKADIHIGIGQTYLEMGEREKAIAHYREGARIAHEAKGFECACAAYFGLGRGHLAIRDMVQSLDGFEQSLAAGRLAATGAMQVFSSAIAGGIAQVEFEQGQAAAVERMREALMSTRSSGDDFGAAWFALELAAALQRLGRLEEAEGHLIESLALFRQRGMVVLVADTLDRLAGLWESQSRIEEARAARSEAARHRATFESVENADRRLLPEPA